MASSSSWKVLSLSLLDAPKLLLKANFDGAGYRVELTDLSRIWAETCSKLDIVQRARDSNSSIDPGEDDAQLKIFLGKIESALNREDGTTLAIAGESAALTINISAKLPHPLPLFEWTLCLQRQPEQHVEIELVTPLLHEASNLRQQIQHLVSELQDKDRIISKVCDRLETSGNDLTTVFPGVSNIKTSRKKGQREQLAKHVKGLADFDEVAWRSQVAKVANGSEIALENEQINEVLMTLPSAEGGVPQGDNWWERLEGRTGFHSQTLDVGVNARNFHGTGPEAHESIDEFQRQGTPPGLRPQASQGVVTESPTAVHNETDDDILQTGPTHDAHVDDESTTEDEDDLDAPKKPRAAEKQVQLSNTQQASDPVPPKKLGAIGGKASQTPASPAAKAPTPEPKLRSRLGAIGGKIQPLKGTSLEPEAELTEESGDVDLAASPARTKVSKIGAIGGKKSYESQSPSRPTAARKSPEIAASSNEASPRRPREVTQEESPAPRQTSQERADRKRDQLKREMEEKAKAPVKKKRKF